MTLRCKYPKTPHLPWSNADNSDTILSDFSCLEGEQVVVTIKMDGENTTCYRDGLHARSVNSGHHPSRSWLKGYHARWKHRIPEGWRVCGENLYAKHSIFYERLPSYFLVFNIWDENNRCLSWSDTLEWCLLLGLHPVETIFQGKWDTQKIRNQINHLDKSQDEGYVVRVERAFSYEEFSSVVAKYVRPHHVQTDRHWLFQPVVPNISREKTTS